MRGEMNEIENGFCISHRQSAQVTHTIVVTLRKEENAQGRLLLEIDGCYVLLSPEETTYFLAQAAALTEVQQQKIIGNFLQWLGDKGYVISDSRSEVVDMLDASYYSPVEKPINQWLADYLGIDPGNLELERQVLNPLHLADEE